MYETMTRKRKSVPLQPEELRALKRFRRGFTSSEDCAAAIGIGRLTLDRILLVGTASEDSVTKIRTALQSLE